MIGPFRGDYEFLSNFFPATIRVYNEGYEKITPDGYLDFPSTEHAFQASKALDLLQHAIIAGVATPQSAKSMGRKVKMRPDWEDIKLDVMYELVRAKFKHSHLRKLLLETGDEELVELNWWKDSYWGVCDGVGENHLGKILMQVRGELRAAANE